MAFGHTAQSSSVSNASKSRAKGLPIIAIVHPYLLCYPTFGETSNQHPLPRLVRSLMIFLYPPQPSSIAERRQ